jgi:hypothetical protein
VTKLQQMLTSLVAAIPAAYLIYVLVMAMLSYSESLSTIAYVVMGLTLLAAATALLIPFGVMFGGNRKPTPAKGEAKQSTGDDIEAVDDDAEVSDEPSETIEALDDDDTEGASEFELDDSSEEIVAQDSDDAFEDFDLDEEEEEVKPKAKKKKK